jgi:O-antigen/teichoic acid export membrane protein
MDVILAAAILYMQGILRVLYYKRKFDQNDRIYQKCVYQPPAFPLLFTIIMLFIVLAENTNFLLIAKLTVVCVAAVLIFISEIVFFVLRSKVQIRKKETHT